MTDDELAQHAVGTILDDGSVGDIVFTYDDVTPLISGAIKPDLNLPGSPTAATPSPADDSEKLATTAFVAEAVREIVPRVPKGTLAGIFAPRRTGTPQDDEFDSEILDPKWTKTGSAAIESYDDHIRSAASFEHAGGSGDVALEQAFASTEDFSFTLLCQLHAAGNSHNVTLYLSDPAVANVAEVQALFGGTGLQIRSVKFVAGVFNQLAISAVLSSLDYPVIFLHIQRRAGNWDFYYSHNGTTWTALGTGVVIPFTIAKLRVTFGVGGASVKTRTVLHWFRKNWITLP